MQLNKRRKIQITLLLFLMLINALAEVLSIASVLPFLAAISDPNILWENNFFRNNLVNFGFNNSDKILIPLTILFCLFVLLSGFIRVINLKLNLALAARIGTDLSCKAYKKTIYQPFDFHVKKNTSELISIIITETKETTWSLNLILQILTSSIICVSLIISGIILNWQITFFLGFFLGIAYLIIFLITKKQLLQNSKILSEKTRLQLRNLQEGLGSIRDILLDNNQEFFVIEYQLVDRKLRIAQMQGMYLGSYPRFIIECSGILLIAFTALYVSSQSDSNFAVIPTLGAIALGAQRLLPICQTIYNSWAGLKNNTFAISKVLAMIRQRTPSIYAKKINKDFSFEDKIELRNLYFSYQGNDEYDLKNINLTIKKGEKIGIVGETGSGKSTLMDILMGLLIPTSGYFKVDKNYIFDKNQASNLIEWRNLIAHVPQNIFLTDNNIIRNVALGVKDNEIDIDRVKRSLKHSQLDSFYKGKKIFNMFVGERGVKLSGGQSQRLGLARALYKNANVLFLDEATSALDNETERRLMQAIDSFEDMTIIIIAHRLTTIANCDKVIELKDGQIVKISTPKDYI